MNTYTLSIRDHGDDDEAAVIRAALLETYAPPTEEDDMANRMYVLNDDDMPDDTMLYAFADALADEQLEVEVEPQVTLMKIMNEHIFEYLNAVSPVEALLDRPTESLNDALIALLTDIGQKGTEIGENEAESNQRVTVAPYTVLAVTGTCVDGSSEYVDLDEAIDKFIENLGQLMNADRGRDYLELIPDCYTDSPEGMATVHGLVIGLVADMTEAEVRSYTFDPTRLYRGVYLFVSNLDDDDATYRELVHAIRQIDGLHSTEAGIYIDGVNYDDPPYDDDPDPTEYGVSVLNRDPVSPLFRELDEAETQVFKLWAREHWTPDQDISPVWHPVVREECARMLEEMLHAQPIRDDAHEMDGHCDKCDAPLQDEDRQCDGAGVCYCDDCGDSSACYPEYAVTDWFDVHESSDNIVAAGQGFIERMIELADEHPTCTYRLVKNGDTIIGLELVVGDNTWDVYPNGEIPVGLFLEGVPMS